LIKERLGIPCFIDNGANADVLIVIFLVIGLVFGSKLAQNLPIAVLRKGFGILMILISLKMIFSK